MPVLINRLFPLFAIGISFLAFYLPAPFVAMKPAIVPLLACVMFLMGVTLSAKDFRRVARRPKAVFTGIILQFTLMPLIAYALTRVFDLGEFAPGIILLGCCAGGTASNLICYLAKGDLALSITLTLTTTLLGVVLTPLLSWLLMDVRIEVDYFSMFLTIIKLVLVPVCAGIMINHWFHQQVQKALDWIPLLSVIAICIIIGIVVALNAGKFSQAGLVLVFAVVLHNLAGLVLGYTLAGLAGLDTRTRRTIAIEVGMQNSGLAVALALKYLTPAAALAGALFSIWHNVSGSLLAAFWSRSAPMTSSNDVDCRE